MHRENSNKKLRRKTKQNKIKQILFHATPFTIKIVNRPLVYYVILCSHVFNIRLIEYNILIPYSDRHLY